MNDADDHPARRTPKTIDVTRLVVRHHEHVVAIKLRVVNLRKVGTQEINLSVRMPGEGFFGDEVEGRSEPGHRDGLLRIEDADGAVICPRATIRWAYAKDWVRIRMPRARHCLDRPAWVRVNGGTSVWFDDTGEGPFFVDDALSARDYSGRYTPRAYKPTL